MKRFFGNETVELAELSNGEKIHLDTVVVGIGVVPNAEIASEAGLMTDNGIVVDLIGRTSDEAIYAAGDVADQPDGLGGRMRLESWSNAQNQAIAVAKTMLGAGTPYQDVPYFWSDQYETQLQILGSFNNYDETVVRPYEGSRFVRFYLKNTKITGGAGVNRSQDVAVARRLMQKRITVDSRHLVSAANLNEFLHGMRTI